MADVARYREADRAQLFLVGALALAVIFVTLAVLLNTAIYTGNIATRDPGPGTGEVVEYESAAVSMADRTLEDANTDNNSSYTDLESTFREGVVVWSDTANVHSSASLADAHVETVATVRGTKIGQNAERNFTDDTGSGDWTVANDSRARAFTMTVNQSSLVDITTSLGLTDSFYVTFDDGERELRAYVYRAGSGNVSVEVENATAGSQLGTTCSVDPGGDDDVRIDLSSGLLGGQPCPAFDLLFDELDERYTVSYQNALRADGKEKINGTYSLVVDRPLGDLQTGADETAGEPYAAPALYSADLQVTYRSSVTYYRTQVRVAPEEPNA